MKKLVIVVLFIISGIVIVRAQTDTLNVMSYNVLYYGDSPGCQGTHTSSHNYLKTIVSYTKPDLLGLVKMEAIPIYAGDNSGTAPAGFADSIADHALNAAYPGRYAHCPYTNQSASDDICVLFYNQQKLGFSAIVSSYANDIDFNTYKLYYRSADLAITHDTLFLYVTLNHTKSGGSSGNQASRAAQIAGEMAQLATRFSRLPNMINMGDFNTHSSTEACYQKLIAPADTGFRFYDPPFYPDAQYIYPANWDADPEDYAACLTTSTKLSASVPNSCGTDGGGKSWYDHMFLSSSIIYNTSGLGYIPHTFRVVGNDGNRTNKSVNDAPANTSAPAAVTDAIFNMSNKYPIMAQLTVTPEAATSKVNEIAAHDLIRMINPIHGSVIMQFAASLYGKDVKIECIDATGRRQIESTLHITDDIMSLPCSLNPGIYYMRYITDERLLLQQIVVKD